MSKDLWTTSGQSKALFGKSNMQGFGKAKIDKELFGKENGKKKIRDAKSKEIFKYIGF